MLSDSRHAMKLERLADLSVPEGPPWASLGSVSTLGFNGLGNINRNLRELVLTRRAGDSGRASAVALPGRSPRSQVGFVLPMRRSLLQLCESSIAFPAATGKESIRAIKTDGNEGGSG